MKIKNVDAMDAYDSLSVLMNANVPSLKGRYAISRAYQKLNEAIKPLMDLRNDLVKQYNDIVNEKTGEVQIKEGMEKEFKEKWDEFIAMEIDIDTYKINLDYLEGATLIQEDKEISIPAIHIHRLRFLINADKEV